MSQQIKWKITKLETLSTHRIVFSPAASFLYIWSCLFMFLHLMSAIDGSCVLSIPLCWGFLNKSWLETNYPYLWHTQIPSLDSRGLNITIIWIVDSSVTPGRLVSCALCIMNQKQTHKEYLFYVLTAEHITRSVYGLYVFIGSTSGFWTWPWIILGSVLRI